MMTIDKAVRIVSDLHHFYRRIPKLSRPRPVKGSDEKHRQVPQQTLRERTVASSENHLASHR